MDQDLILIFSLISLGFFGGFSHCISMCGPFVLTQVDNRMKNIELKNYNNFEKLKNLSLFPYHLGRITTYSLVGFVASFLTQNIQNYFGFKILSLIFLIAAILVFLSLLININFANTKIKLRFKLKLVKNFRYKIPFLENILSILFKNPTGTKGYLLGIILGFIPCGLLYSAYLICSNMTNHFFAILGMAAFGVATFPSLFLTGLGGKILKDFSELKIVLSNILILINISMLLLLIKKIVT